MESTLSALQQKAVWDGWLGAEVRASYFAELSGNYRWHQRLLTVTTLVASSGAFITLMGTWLPTAAAQVLTAIAAGVSVWSLVAQNQKCSTDCSDLYARWSTLANQYGALWGDMYGEDAPERLEALQARDVEISKTSNQFPLKTDRLEYWEDHVVRNHVTA